MAVIDYRFCDPKMCTVVMASIVWMANRNFFTKRASTERNTKCETRLMRKSPIGRTCPLLLAYSPQLVNI